MPDGTFISLLNGGHLLTHARLLLGPLCFSVKSDWRVIANSPSRERRYELVIEDLRKLRKITRHIYWSVDAIRPAWMVEIARRIAAENIDIFWGTKVRLDKNYTAEEARILKNGGCLAISVGIETGSNRLLKLMDKGTTVERYHIILQKLKDAGIAVYPMTFIGFPTETIQEANSTIDFLLENQQFLAMLAMPATFYLEGNAIIAQRPEAFCLARGFGTF